MTDSYFDTVFFDDAPKLDVAADRLGHSVFAQRISQVLRSISAPQGYVIGLHGPWGSGKSTVLNFVEQGLKQAEQDTDNALLVVRFEPWIISGHQDVTAAFMKLLAEKLRSTAQNRAKKIGKAALRGVRGGADPVLDAIATIGVIADPTGGVATKLASAVGKKAVAAAAGKWLEEPSLQTSYSTLVKALKELDHRIVVMVDDIERLTAEEIRDLMTMVKTLGKLPNVIYLLCYDRNVVWGALKTIDPDSRSGAFAEKIVQHELELPPPSRSAMLALLNDALGFLELGDEPGMRRNAMVRAGLIRWARQPRDIVRLANSLKFCWPALKGEIDPDDLICMEGLRLHDRELFEWIRDNREALIDSVMPLDRDERAEAAAAFAEQFKNTRSDAIGLMVRLFPNRAEMFRQERFGMDGETLSSVRARRGIATAAGYDAYFSLRPGVMTLSKRLVDVAVSSFDDPESLEAALRAALAGRDEFGSTLMGDMLAELSSRLDHGAKATPTLLSVLLNMAAEIGDARWVGDIVTPRMQHHFLVSDILKQWGHDQRHRHLVEIYASQPPLAAQAALHVHLARSMGALPSTDSYLAQFVTRDELDELGNSLVGRIEAAAADGTLAEEPVYYDIASAWALHAGYSGPRTWLSEVSQTGAKQIAKIALGLLGYARTDKGLQYGMSDKPDTQLYDVDELLAACTPLPDVTDLTPDEAARVRALASGLEGWQVRMASKPQKTSSEDAATENE
jgi:hypothetical protein